MKKRIFATALALCLLTGCAATVEPPEQTQATDPDVPTSAPAEVPTIPPTEEAETMDPYTALFPADGNIPKKKEIVRLAQELAQNTRGRISEITYTWKDGKISMELLQGVHDDYQVLKAPEESPVQRIYDPEGLYNYLLYLPEGYDSADTEKKWPVIFFFHGIGESGSDLEAVMSYGMPKYLEDGGKVDAIMIAPQCPGDSHWADTDVEVEKLQQFVPQMAETYPIDTERMYLTGLSMGGRCTWKLALAMPDTFAAIAVVCGRTNTYEFETIQTMPIWMFHGAQDSTVSFDNVNKILPVLDETGHRYYKLTVFPFQSHDIWTAVYSRPEVYDWLLSQSLTNNLHHSEG